MLIENIKFKRLIFTYLVVCLFGMVHAQVATWMVPPKMDSIRFDVNNKVFFCNRKDTTFIWKSNGTQLIKPTTMHVTPFVNHFCVIIDPQSNGLCGIQPLNGNYKEIDRNNGKCRYIVDAKYPYYSSGFLLVMDTQDSLYHYVLRSGNISKESYAEAYPFINGMASVSYYKNPNKRRNKVAKFINSKFEDIPMQINGKFIDVGEFEFISSLSSLNKEKIAICISGKQVYKYDYKSDDCINLSADGSDNKDSYVKLLNKTIMKEGTSDGGFTISTNKGKMKFSHIGEYEGLITDNFAPVIKSSNKKDSEVATNLNTFEENGLLGIIWKPDKEEKEEKIIVPPQFEEVKDKYRGGRYNDLAVVRKNGKYGILSTISNKEVKFQINNGDTLFFSQDTCRSQLTITYPFKIMRAAIDTIVSCGFNKCEVIMSSSQENVTSSGSKFSFDCIPHLPHSVDGVWDKQTYSFFVKYNDLVSIPYSSSNDVNYKSLLSGVNPFVYLRGDTVMLEFEIVYEKGAQNVADAVINGIEQATVEVEKIGKNLFRVWIINFNPGKTEFAIEVKEPNGYSKSFPFLLKYKPAERKKAASVSINACPDQ